MTEKVFKLEIVTPTKVLFDGEVISFSAPGVMGGFQVLYNHAPLLAEIDIGEARLTRTDGSELRFAVSGGFFSVIENHATLLAESAEVATEIDRERASVASDRLRQKLTEKLNTSELYETEQALKRALNRIRIAEKQ